MFAVILFFSVFLSTVASAQSYGAEGDVHLQKMTISQLLRHHVEIADELQRREVVRSGNAPTGDLAEYLFVTAFGWQIAGPSQKGFDATDGSRRYQIKARRDYGQSGARQLSSIRNLDGFDYLAVLIFDRWYRVSVAAILPVSIVADQASYVDYTASYRFYFKDELLKLPGVIDVTEQIVRQSGY